MLRRFAWASPLAAVMLAGCFATRNDVRLLQADVNRLHATAEATRKAEADQARADQARRDSIHAAEIRQLLAVNRSLADSLAQLSESFIRFRANVNENQRQAEDQFASILTAIGVGQSTIADMRSRLESQREERAVAAGDTSAASGAPSPRRMLQMGIDGVQKGATGQARMVLQDLLSQTKSDTLASQALYWIGESYAADKMDAEADSVYALVVEKYPKSEKAPTAMFKRAEALAKAQKPSQARAMFQRVIREYPRSNEAGLAQDRVKQLPPG